MSGVYFNGDEVPRDEEHLTGWDYDPDAQRVDFYSDSCDSLQAGEVDELLVVYGCPIIKD